MVGIKTLRLLDALLSGSSGSETEKLKALYKEAFSGADSFKELKNLMERSEFHGLTGRELLTKSEEVIHSAFTNAGNFGDSLTVMEYLIEKIHQELESSEAYIRSAAVSGKALNVIDKQLADQATAYYETLFQYVCCIYASFYGDSILKSMNVKTGIRSASLIQNINDELALLFSEAHRLPKPSAWRIVRKNFSGLNELHYSGFMLEYSSVTKEYLQNECHQLTPTLFVPKNGSSVLCCGIGYLTSLGTAPGTTLFGASITTDPALNCLDSLDIDYTQLNIVPLLNKIAGGNVCILQPETVVELLNRYFMVRTAKKNHASGCALCGKTLCRHFIIKHNFTMDDSPLYI